MIKRMIRRWSDLPIEEIRELAKKAVPESYTAGGFANGPYMPEFSEVLNGRSFRFKFDDGFLTQDYEFTDKHTLKWNDGNGIHTDYCHIHVSEPGITFVEHFVKDAWPVAARTLVIDEIKGYVTVVDAHIGNESTNREVSRQFHFGKIDGMKQTGEAHGFTKDLIGRAIQWVYKHDDFHVKHIYSSEYYYTYAMLKGGECWMASNPADFVKINDHLYIFSFVEERQPGTQGLFLMDLDKMHDIGSFFGVNTEPRIECYTVGAIGKWEKPETCFEDMLAEAENK